MESEGKNLGGRPPKPIDWDIIEKLCHIQCTVKEIAAFFGCHEDTITRACKEKNGVGFAAYYKEKRLNGVISIRRARYQLGIEKGHPLILESLNRQYVVPLEDRERKLLGEDAREVGEIGQEEVIAELTEIAKEADSWSSAFQPKSLPQS